MGPGGRQVESNPASELPDESIIWERTGEEWGEAVQGKASTPFGKTNQKKNVCCLIYYFFVLFYNKMISILNQKKRCHM